MSEAQQAEINHILATVEGEVFANVEGGEVLVVGDGWIIAVDWDGSTSETTLGEWSTGWSA